MSEPLDLDSGGANAGRVGRLARPAALRIYAAPALGAEFNAVRPALVASACWAMDDARFAFDSSFVRPAARTELAALRALLAANPGAVLSVFGHADPTGRDDYNKALSGRRARVIHALLVRDAAGWEEVYGAPLGRDAWGLAAVQRMLATVPDGSGFPYYAAAVDGIEGAHTRDALRRFQTDHGVAVTGRNDAPTRRALFTAYMAALCDADDGGAPLRVAREDFLGGGGDPGGKAAYQGCSEFNPVLVFSAAEARDLERPPRHAARDAENACNRRVVVYLFAPGTRVEPARWPCPRVSEGPEACRARFWSDGEARRSPQAARRRYEDTRDTFACRFYERLARRSPCETSGALRAFRVRLVDAQHEPIPRAPCRVLGGAGPVGGAADDAGWLSVRSAARPQTLTITWTTPERAAEAVYPFAQQVFVDVGEGDDAVRRRLHNLGYGAGLAADDGVRAFQRDFGRTETGVLADVRDDVIAWHDGGEKPLDTG